MHVYEIEAMALCKSMREAVADGYTWMAYASGEFVGIHNKPEFFKSEEEARDYCISNYSDYDQFTGREILSTLSALQAKINESLGRQDIDYYFIYKNNDVSITLRTNPDQNGLYNSEGNAFTDALFDHWERSNKAAINKNVIDKELSQFPIAELNNPVLHEAIIAALQNGEKHLVTFERSIVPADHFKDFVVLEHEYPNGGTIYVRGHKIREINSFAEFNPAWNEMQRQAYNIANDPAKPNSEIMLVGRYQGKKLEYDFEGAPETSTGFLLATACSVTGHGERPDYEVFLNADPTNLVVVKDTLYAELNAVSGRVEFADILMGRKDIDVDFWKKEPIALYFDQAPTNSTISNQINSPHLKNNIMNQDNLDYLKNALLYMGFGDRLQADLEKNIRDGKQNFVLQDSHEFYNGNRKMESTLHFNRGKENEMYFFNKYDATMIKPDSSSLSQTFYINQVKVENKELEKTETKLSSYTLKEATNLLDGRAVEKEFYSQQNVPYSAWKQLDFSAKDKHGNYEYKTFHENYGYDVTAALERVPVKELERNSAKEDLIRSLKKGNLQAATAENGERVYLTANPQFKSINVFDKDMKPVRDLNKLQDVDIDKSQGTAKSKETSLNGNTQEVNAGGDTKATSKADQVKNNNIAGSDDLLEKNDKKKVTGKSKGKAEETSDDDDLMPKKHRRNKTGQHL